MHRAATVPYFRRTVAIQTPFHYKLNFKKRPSPSGISLGTLPSHSGGHLQAPVRVGGVFLGQVGHAGSDREVGHLRLLNRAIEQMKKTPDLKHAGVEWCTVTDLEQI